MRLRVAVYVLRTAVFATLLVPGAAWGHAVLVKSDPVANSVVSGDPGQFILEFNSRIDAARSELLLVGVRQTLPLTLLGGSAPNVLRANRIQLPEGGYLLRWQVLAMDGHVTRGEIRFRVH